MIGNVEDLGETDEYMTKALKPIIKFRKYRMADIVALREF
jgi:hypothetical protein